MRPKFQSKQSIVINASNQFVWEYNQDLKKIAEYHPTVNRVELISDKQYREAGVSYECHLKDGKNTCIEKDIEIIPMKKIVTVLPQDTMGLTKLLPDYIVETELIPIGESATKIEISHFYSVSSPLVFLLNIFIKLKITRQTNEMLASMKKIIESKYVKSA
jgi:hypothetical protein